MLYTIIIALSCVAAVLTRWLFRQPAEVVVVAEPAKVVDPAPTVPVQKQPSSSFAAPMFPYLKIANLVANGTPQTFLPNTREPIKFDCNACCGEMLVMLRTDPRDSHFDWAFQGKKRFFELHFQLELKQTPKGVLYLGGEVPRKMNLGAVSNLACHAMLSVIRRLAPTGHFSMGNQEELPHIVFPLWHAAERLVVTKPGTGAPPHIGQGAIPETDSDRAHRLKDNTLGKQVLQQGDVITFSFHSAYMDLVEWKVRGLVGIRDQTLSQFWDTMPLRVAVYDHEDAKRHVNKDYYLLFELVNTVHQRTTGGDLVVFPGREEENLVGFKSQYSSTSSLDMSTDALSNEDVALPQRKEKKKRAATTTSRIRLFVRKLAYAVKPPSIGKRKKNL